MLIGRSAVPYVCYTSAHPSGYPLDVQMPVQTFNGYQETHPDACLMSVLHLDILWTFRHPSGCTSDVQRPVQMLTGCQGSLPDACQMSRNPTTGGSRLSQIFWEHENLSGLSIILLIPLFIPLL